MTDRFELSTESFLHQLAEAHTRIRELEEALRKEKEKGSAEPGSLNSPLPASGLRKPYNTDPLQ